MKILVTGAAGFIGFHLARRLLDRGDHVIGLDNLNPYYDVSLKEARLAQLRVLPGFVFERVDLADSAGVSRVFAEHAPEGVANLAAQAGVRYSLEHPHTYIDSNITGFLNILEGCRHHPVSHLVFASSSSVYGANQKMPFSVHDHVDHPVSLYAASKRANELMAHSYSHLYGIPATGLRFFTVYGPWGRPDMALSIFTHAILTGQTIDVYNFGRMKRDFTYIDDIVEGIVRVLDRPPASAPAPCGVNLEPGRSSSPYRIYNIGNHRPVELGHFIQVLEKALGRTAKKRMLPLQPGDVPESFADVEDLMRDTGFSPSTPIEVGIPRFIDWHLAFYGNGGG